VLTAPVKGFQAERGGGSIVAQRLGSGFMKMGTVLPKATLVDIPLALTEGLHQMPKLYGEKVRDHGKVTDMKSAGIVAGKVSQLLCFHNTSLSLHLYCETLLITLTEFWLRLCGQLVGVRHQAI